MHRDVIKTITAAVITMLMTTFIPIALYANDGSMGRTPDGVFPMQESDVVMESEEITVDLEKNTAECIFVFHNTGEAKAVLMGFPGKLENNYESLTDPVNLEIKNFNTYVKGKELKVTHEKNTRNIDTGHSDDLHFSEWFTFEVHFEAGEKLTVRNSYSFVPSHFSDGNVQTGYVIKTGALWKGNLGSTKVTFRLGKIQPYQIEDLCPGGYRYEGNNIVWERKDFEPEYDLSIIYNSYKYTKELLAEAGMELGEEQKKRISDYDNVNKLSAGGKTAELLQLYNSAVREEDYLLALYIKGCIPGEDLPEPQPVLGDIKVEKEVSDFRVSSDITMSKAAFVNMRISHMDSGKEIIDFDGNESVIGFDFSYGVEYTIKYTLTDWLGNTQQKEMKFKRPDEKPIETPASSSVEQVSAAVGQASLPEPPAETSAVTEKQEKGRTYKLSPYILIPGSMVLMGLLIVAIFKSRKDTK